MWQRQWGPFGAVNTRILGEVAISGLRWIAGLGGTSVLVCQELRGFPGLGPFSAKTAPSWRTRMVAHANSGDGWNYRELDTRVFLEGCGLPGPGLLPGR